jgi:opacity protein-like surface antigen
VTNLLPAAALLLVATTGGAFAADFVPTPSSAAAIADPVRSGLYVILLGGVSLPGTLDFDPGVNFDLEAGYAVGGAIGWQTGLGGLSLEIDFMQTRHQLAVQADTFFGTRTLMANAKYTFWLNDSFDVYAGAGLGAYGITSQQVPGAVDIEWASGYQVMVGADMKLTENLSALAEYRYQNSFEPIDIDGPAFVGNSALLAGLKYQF